MTVIMIDTNIYDALQADSVTLSQLENLMVGGTVRVISTHIQEDEIGKIPNEAKQKTLLEIPTEEVPTSVFIMGKSRIGKAKLGIGNANGIEYRLIEKGNPKHIEDAIIAVTAADEAAVLVTNDGKLKRKILAQSPKLEVWTYDQLKSFVMAQ